MNPTKRVLTLVLAALALATVFVSCGAQDSKPAQIPNDTTETASPGTKTSGGPSVTPDSPDDPTPTGPDSTDSGPKNASQGSSDAEVSDGETPTPAHTPTPTPTPTIGPTETPTPEPTLFQGYDLDFSEGDFWRFRWEYTDRSCSQGSGCKTTRDDGVFQVTLGEPKEWKGVTVYRVSAVGETGYTDNATTRTFVPRWDYLGVDGNRLVATNATGSSPLVTLFDAQTGVWPGSGFFSGRFPDDTLVGASPGQLTGSHEFASWDGVETGPWHFVRAAGSGGECSTFDGRILCPSEEKFDYTETEYYRPGIGPFAYIFNYSATFSGGGYTTSFQTGERLALVASSLMGDEPGDFGKPTPTSTSTPSPTPVVLGDPIYGPADGSLELDPGSNQIPEFASGVNIDVGVVDVVFENPAITGKWSHGILFRNAAEETFHAVYITSDGKWGHFARGGSLRSQVVLAQGQFDVDRTGGARTRLTVWFGVPGGKSEGVFLIDGQAVAELDLSFAGAVGAGDAVVVSGLFPADEFTGATTHFTDFTVYGKP